MTTPSGLLLWGQAGEYDAIEDRGVIFALSGGRMGLASPPVLSALPGLVVGIGPWAGIVDCEDRSAAVIGSRETQSVAVAAGGAQARTDVIWADIDPDAGTWAASVIPSTGTAGRSGLLLGTVVVPPNANSSAAMDLLPGPANGGLAGAPRGLLSHQARNPTGTSSANTWQTALHQAWSGNITIRPGRWYRVTYSMGSPSAEAGPLTHRIGVGWHAGGAPSNTSVMLRAETISYRATGAIMAGRCEYLFRHPPTAAEDVREFEGRIWAVGSGGRIRHTTATGQGDGVLLTVEDMGT